MEDPSLDADLLGYLRRAHGALARKRVELRALELRFEPPNPLIGVKTKRPSPDEIQPAHVLRRYDEALSYFRGYTYNPGRAYFDRDPYGNGLLQFENGVSLLGTRPDQDRWRRRRSEIEGVPPSAGVTRSARIDAFLAMLERRQAMTELSGMAPTAVFVGELMDVSTLQQPGRRAPPRPHKRRIAIHRYRRICFSMRSVTGPFGTIHCVAVAERSQRADRAFRIHTLCSGSAVKRDPQSPDWRRQVIQDVRQHWSYLALRENYAVFEAPMREPFIVVERADRSWPMACPQGDAQMLYRLGLLLESPNLAYAPWESGKAIGSLSRLLELAAPAQGRIDTLSQWMRYTLMCRVYPYALLAHKDMLENMRYPAYASDTPLTEGEVKRFQDSVRPAADTVWITRPPQKKKVQPAKTSGEAIGSAPAAAADDGEKEEKSLLPVGVNGPQRGRGRLGRLGRGGRPGAAKKKKAKEPVIGRPQLVVRLNPEVQALISIPKSARGLNAYDARFLATRRAVEATNRLEPFYVIKSTVRSEIDGYRIAREWRHAVIRDSRVLWTVGLQALQFLHGAGGRQIWSQGAQEEDGSFMRAAWEVGMERRAPRLMSPGYQKLIGAPPVRPAFATDQEREAARKNLPRLVRKTIDGVGVLAEIARGTQPPPEVRPNQFDFQVQMAAVVASMAKDAILFLGPTSGLRDPSKDPRPELEREMEKRLPSLWTPEGATSGRGAATLRSLGAFTLLSWEWGRTRGMVRFLHWIDAIGERVGNPDPKTRPISTRVLETFTVLADLAVGVLGRRTLVAPAPAPVAVAPSLPRLPGGAGDTATLDFVAELYGYQEGELRGRFGEAARQWVEEGAESAVDLIDTGAVRVELEGFATNPDPDTIRDVIVGWDRKTAGPVALAALELRYDWTSEFAPTTTARVATATASQPQPVDAPIAIELFQQEEEEEEEEQEEIVAVSPPASPPGSPAGDLVHAAMKLLLQHPEVAKALLACGHDPSQIVLTLPPPLHPAAQGPYGSANSSSSDESGQEAI